MIHEDASRGGRKKRVQKRTKEERDETSLRKKEKEQGSSERERFYSDPSSSSFHPQTMLMVTESIVKQRCVRYTDGGEQARERDREREIEIEREGKEEDCNDTWLRKEVVSNSAKISRGL
jgi:hypothetical protein